MARKRATATYYTPVAVAFVITLFTSTISLQFSDAREIGPSQSERKQLGRNPIEPDWTFNISSGHSGNVAHQSTGQDNSSRNLLVAILCLVVICDATVFVLSIIWICPMFVKGKCCVDSFMSNEMPDAGKKPYSRGSLIAIFSAILVSVLFVFLGAAIAATSATYLYKVRGEGPIIKPMEEGGFQTFRRTLESRLSTLPDQMQSKLSETHPDVDGLAKNVSKALSARIRHKWKPIFDTNEAIASSLFQKANDAQFLLVSMERVEKSRSDVSRHVDKLNRDLSGFLYVLKQQQSGNEAVADLESMEKLEQPQMDRTLGYLNEARALIRKAQEVAEEFRQNSGYEVPADVISGQISLENIPESMSAKMEGEAAEMVEKKIAEIKDVFKIVEGILSSTESHEHDIWSFFAESKKDIKFYFGTVLPLVVLLSLVTVLLGLVQMVGAILGVMETKCFAETTTLQSEGDLYSIGSKVLTVSYALSSVTLWIFWALAVAGSIISSIAITSCIVDDQSGNKTIEPYTSGSDELPEIPAASKTEINAWRSCATLQDVMNDFGAGGLLFYDTSDLESVRPEKDVVLVAANKTLENFRPVDASFIASAKSSTGDIGEAAQNLSKGLLEESYALENRQYEKLARALNSLALDASASELVRQTARKLKKSADAANSGVLELQKVVESLSASFKGAARWAEDTVQAMTAEERKLAKWNEFVDSATAKDLQVDFLMGVDEFVRAYSAAVGEPLSEAREDTEVCREPQRAAGTPDSGCSTYFFPAALGMVGQYLTAMFLTFSTIFTAALKYSLTRKQETW